jgi:GntR family transcriptional regulator, transcriptional repressor for pyruvate dehydrogenase complex
VTRMTDTSPGLEELEPVGRTSVLEAVLERLESLIFDRFQPGDVLPSEGKLAAALGVSRLTVREATRTLEARGLLEISQGRRPTVAAPNGALIGDFFQIAVRRDPRALLELLEVRRALEVHIASLAARRASKGEIADMEMSIAAMRAGEDDSEAFHAADVRFHENLAEASGNRLFVFLIEAFAGPLKESRLRSFAGHQARGGGVEDVIQQHETILDAVKARTPRDAAKAMRDHLAQTEQDLRTQLQDTSNVERIPGEDHLGRASRRRRRIA